MFINAYLRPVLHGCKTFVPQRAELLQQRERLVDMTNNGVSAWADFRDAASLASTPESGWDHRNEDFGDNENTPSTNAYHRYHQDISVASRALASGFAKDPSPIGYQEQFQGQRLPTLPIYDEQMVAGLSVFDDQTSSMTRHEYQSWGQESRRNSFAQASNGRNSTKNFQYQPASGSCLTSFPSALPLTQPQPSYSYGNAAILDESFNLHQVSPSTEYSTYSSSTGSSADSLSVNQDIPYVHSNAITTTWWHQDLQTNTNQHNTTYTLPLDDPPKLYNPQRYLGLWDEDSTFNNWTMDSAVPKYISPKQVPLNRFYATSSSSESGNGALYSLSDSTAQAEDLSDFSSREVLSVVEPEVPQVSTTIHRSHHALPETSSSIRRNIPVLRSNDFSSSKRSKRRAAEFKSGSNSRTKTASEPSTQSHSQKAVSNSQKVPLKKIEPKPVGQTEPQPRAETAQSSQAMHHRDAKDDFLVKSKLAGMSYKDIRRQGRFTEAESTLRGRFRTLTKHKNARVRKPEWDDNDIRLLKKATRKLAQNPGTSKARIPWKQVAEYITNHGGSYHFGNATCRKKWDELQEQSGF